MKCKEMCFYASLIDEGYTKLSPLIATTTGRMKRLYMKNKNSSGESASNTYKENVRKFNSTCEKKNTTKNAHNTRLSADDECDDASFNTYFTHDFTNSEAHTSQHHNCQSFSTTYTNYISSDPNNRSTRNESQTFTFNNSVNAQNGSYDVWNTDMTNKLKYVLNLLGH
ncbi:hypothetical protein ACJIZ3_011443 [Penstemon smallii]|uniref:Uncharacterized protein n=1 Tax=Penstemon smallii TaxID=265156 RepID=A0ABD3UJ52_9LAMI